MSHPKSSPSPTLVAVLTCLALTPCLSSTALADTVSTAVGNGADVEMREQNNNSADSTTQNTRTSSGGDRNEIVALKFDLSGYTLTDLTNVSLHLYSYRLDTSTRVVDVYGVQPGTVAPEGGLTPATWSEGNLTTFGSMPGLLATDSDYLTQSIDTGNTVYLGQLTMSGSSIPEGGIATYDFATITTFIQGYPGSSVSFLLAAGNTSTGQYRTCTRETTTSDTGVLSGTAGDFAPYLSFTKIPALMPPDLSYSITGGGTGIDFSWTGNFRLQSQTNTSSTGIGTNWFDYPGGETSPVSVPVDKLPGSVFFRLSQ